MTRKQKERVTYEFKSNLLDNTYPQIKRKMLYKLNTFDCKIVYSYSMLVTKIYECYKEELYIILLTKILESINDDLTVVVFDSFGNKKIENSIVDKIKHINNIVSIKSEFSFDNKGLQFADNVCGIIRKHLSGNDKNNYFDIIARKTKEC